MVKKAKKYFIPLSINDFMDRVIAEANKKTAEQDKKASTGKASKKRKSEK